MRWLRFALLVCCASILQAGFLFNLNIKLDLLLVLLVFCAIYYSSSEAIVTSFVLGFAADLFGSAMGPQMISFGLVGTALTFLHRVIAIKKKPYQAITIFVVAVLAGALAGLLNSLKGQTLPTDIESSVFFTALYSCLAGPFLFIPVALWMRTNTFRFRKR